jgi:RHH-type rel operon transcriptional repressor/antitoxin RelB
MLQSRNMRTQALGSQPFSSVPLAHCRSMRNTEVGSMPMVSLRLESSTVVRLNRLAKLTGRTKAFYITQAIDHHLEDLELAYLAERETLALKTGRSKSSSLDEAERHLGLVD